MKIVARERDRDKDRDSRVLPNRRQCHTAAPLKVPAPPMATTGAPSRATRGRLEPS